MRTRQWRDNSPYRRQSFREELLGPKNFLTFFQRKWQSVCLVRNFIDNLDELRQIGGLSVNTGLRHVLCNGFQVDLEPGMLDLDKNCLKYDASLQRSS